jgi:hypothetical protein
LVATAIPHIHPSYGNGFVAVTCNKARERRVVGIIQIIHIHRAIGIRGVGGKKEIGACIASASAIQKEIFGDFSGLGRNDLGMTVRTGARGGIGGIEALLNLCHGLLGGHFGEAGGGVLAGEIAGRNLLDAGGGEEGDRNGGEERRDQEGEDQGGAGIRGFKPQSSAVEGGRPEITKMNHEWLEWTRMKRAREWVDQISRNQEREKRDAKMCFVFHYFHFGNMAACRVFGIFWK